MSEEDKKEVYEKNFEMIIIENFPNKGKETVNSKWCRVPYRINPRRNTPRQRTNQTNKD